MFSKFPTFVFDGWSLREINPTNDMYRFFQYMNHPSVSKFVGGSSVPKTHTASYTELCYWQSLFVQRYSYYWAISNAQDEMIGTVGFNVINRDHLRAELSYDLDPYYWGRGIMIQAVKKIIDFIFDEYGIVRIQATVADDNIRSIALLDKLNFVREGTLQKYEKLGDRHADLYMYSIISPHYR